jgi:hypothetical protein
VAAIPGRQVVYRNGSLHVEDEEVPAALLPVSAAVTHVPVLF